MFIALSFEVDFCGCDRQVGSEWRRTVCILISALHEGLVGLVELWLKRKLEREPELEF